MGRATWRGDLIVRVDLGVCDRAGRGRVGSVVVGRCGGAGLGWLKGSEDMGRGITSWSLGGVSISGFCDLHSSAILSGCVMRRVEAAFLLDSLGGGPTRSN